MHRRRIKRMMIGSDGGSRRAGTAFTRTWIVPKRLVRNKIWIYFIICFQEVMRVNIVWQAAPHTNATTFNPYFTLFFFWISSPRALCLRLDFRKLVWNCAGVCLPRLHFAIDFKSLSNCKTSIKNCFNFFRRLLSAVRIFESTRHAQFTIEFYILRMVAFEFGLVEINNASNWH